MAAIKEALIGAGLSEVRTYINSGNVLFTSRVTSAQRLSARIEKALEQHTRMAIKVLVVDYETLRRLADAIPHDWVDDKTMRTYVLLLWHEVDDPAVVDRLPVMAGIDDVMYTPGAVIWRVDRENLGQSRMNLLVGAPLYKKITIRNVNTVRKLNEMTAVSAASAARISR